MKNRMMQRLRVPFVAMVVAASWALPSSAQLIVVGVDNKVTWDEGGKLVNSAPDKDAVVVLDIADRLNPKVVATLPLVNSVFGPPTNLAITPDGSVALVANSMDWAQDAGAWKGTPGNDIYVIDLKARPPALVATLKGGKQPSGMAINRAGNMALVANRGDNSLTVLSIAGRDVKVVDSVAMGEQVSAVAFLPDG